MADTPAPRGRKRKGRKRSSTSDAAAADPAADSAAAAADVSEEDSRKRMCRRREPEIQPCEDIVFVRENGFRRVLPYDYDFKCFCKGRWLGRTLMDVFESEFRAETPERYVSCEHTAPATFDLRPLYTSLHFLSLLLAGNWVLVSGSWSQDEMRDKGCGHKSRETHTACGFAAPGHCGRRSYRCAHTTDGK
eukprot:m.61534 g.61534  ORF g.61534 m.61534 type:complete len:191 (-) comp7343_c0_seq4:1030-1602(-)